MTTLKRLSNIFTMKKLFVPTDNLFRKYKYHDDAETLQVFKELRKQIKSRTEIFYKNDCSGVKLIHTKEISNIKPANITYKQVELLSN